MSIFAAMRFSLVFILFSQLAIAQKPSNYVNPFIGTGGHGHTFPGATVPFGMVQLSPDTRVDGSWDGCGGGGIDVVDGGRRNRTSLL